MKFFELYAPNFINFAIPNLILDGCNDWFKYLHGGNDHTGGCPELNSFTKIPQESILRNFKVQILFRIVHLFTHSLFTIFMVSWFSDKSK